MARATAGCVGRQRRAAPCSDSASADQRRQRRAHVVRDGAPAARCAAAPTPSRPPPAAPRRRSARAPARSRSARASVSSCCACSGISSQRGCAGSQRQHAAHPHRRLQRHVVPGLRRQRGGGQAGGLAVAEGPVGDAGVEAGRRRRRACTQPVVAHRSPAPARWPPKWPLHRGRAELDDLRGLERRRQFARELEQRLRAPLAAGRRRRPGSAGPR